MGDGELSAKLVMDPTPLVTVRDYLGRQSKELDQRELIIKYR